MTMSPSKQTARSRTDGHQATAAGEDKRGGTVARQESTAGVDRVWRFVLMIGPRPDGQPVPFVLDRVAACTLGPGATLLEEPYGPAVGIRFDRPAPTSTEAVAAAVRQVESLGLAVLRVDNDDWVTATDVAHRVGRSRETVRLWATGQAGPGGFPLPANPRRETTFYSWAEVLPWLRGRLGMQLPKEEPTLVAANLAVQLRALLPRLPQPKAILDLIEAPGVPPATVGERR